MSASVTTDTLAHYPHIPEFYFVASGLDEDGLGRVHEALAITPLTEAIVFDPHDTIYAFNFSDHVTLVATEADARNEAQHLWDTAESGQFARSIIVRSQSNPLTGVYQSREAPIAC